MKRKVLLVPAVIGGLIVLGWGVSTWHYLRTHVSTDNAQVGGHLIPVMAKVGGYVEAVAVAENEHVTQGELLVRIDDDELQNRVRQAEAELAAALAMAGGEAGDGQAQAQVAQAERQGSALAAQIEAARANLQKAEQDLERVRGLAEQQIVPQQQLDAARAAAAAARAALRALEQQRSGAVAAVSAARAGVRLAGARVQAARAALDAARLQLSYATITAPVSGIVSKRAVEPGQLLQPGQSLMTIVADTGVFVVANLKETQLSGVKPGNAVEFEVDAWDGCHAKGEVASISAATGSQFALLPTDNASGNFTKVVQRVPVRIRVVEDCGEARPLRPGMSVVVHIDAS